MFAWLRTLLGLPREPPLPSIVADDTGVTLTTGRSSRAVPWSAVRRIAAFKQDLETHDRIVLLLEVDSAGDPTITLTEDAPGFATLFAPMEESLGVDPSWYLSIMTPAFEPTPVVLYVRGAP